MSTKSITRRWLYLAAAGAMAAATLSNAAPANADPDPVVNYARYNYPAMCSVLDEYPTMPGVTGVLEGIQSDSGFTSYNAGRALAYGVQIGCPRYVPLLLRFANTYSPSETGANA